MQIKVRYCETDQMGLVHHGSYVNYFEEARTQASTGAVSKLSKYVSDSDLVFKQTSNQALSEASNDALKL